MAFLIKQNQVNTLIPENSKAGLQNTIKVFKKGKVESLQVRVNISHTYIGDLEIMLTSPEGHSMKLHDRSGGAGKDINLLYSGEQLNKFIGQKAKGNWTLTVKDFAAQDEGTLNNWSLHLNTPSTKESEIFIPDGEGKKLISQQLCAVSGKIKDISATVDIEHGYIGDLGVTLVGPDVSVVLHDRKGGKNKNLQKTYSAKKDLKDFIGTSAKGTWSLEIADFAPRDSGKIKSWNIDLKV